MQLRIRSRLVVSHVIVALVAVISASVFYFVSFRELLVKYQEHTLLTNAYTIANALSSSFGPQSDHTKINKTLRRLTSRYSGLYAVIDQDSLVVAATSSSVALHKPISGVNKALTGALQVNMVRGLHDSDEHIVAAVPIERDGATKGAVRAWLLERDYQASLGPIRKMTTAALGGVIIISIVISLFLAQALLGPIKKMRILSKRIAGGDFTTRLTEPSKDELGELASDLNTMAARLHELENTQRDFMGNVSHELRSPVSNIRVTSEVLQRRVERLGDGSVQLFSTIITETERLESMIDELLELSAISSGHTKLDIDKVGVRSFLQELIAYIEPVAGQKSISVALTVDGDIYINVDKARMTRAISSLLDNAVKFTPPNGRIDITAVSSEHKVTIEVADSGVGIPSENLPRIFERFYRVDKARTRTGGTGIGLSIVKHTVEAHYGYVEVDSTLGVGSKFRVILPI